MYHYQAFQLTIQSELALPELCELTGPVLPSVDVKISFAPVSPNGLEAPMKKGVTFQTKEGEFWLNIPQVARFLVLGGREIKIDNAYAADEENIRLFLLGSCFGVILMQRGLLVLHGNAIQIGHHAISFTGLSGAGKSTLAGLFFKRGYSILADDVCALNEQGEVVPSFPQLKLWADAAKQLDIDTTTLRKIRPNIEKYALPLTTNFYAKPLALKLVYILKSHNQDELNTSHFTGANKFRPLYSQTYRLHFVKAMCAMQRHRMLCGQLANRIAVVGITRPNSGCSLDTIADYIETDLATRGLLCD